MSDKRLKELLAKYLNGTATPEEQKLVDDWYDTLSDGSEMRIPDNDRTDLRSDYWQSLHAGMQKHSKERSMSPMIWAAAAVSAILSAVIFFTPVFQSQDDAAVLAHAELNLKTIENKTDQVKTILLADSSEIQLSPGSEIKISPHFNLTDRQVCLSGQAFFDIQRNESKPFYVVANEVVTRVLGTSFTVSAYPGDTNITVAVESGKVSVYTSTSNDITSVTEDVVLEPNQQAVYDKTERRVSRTLVKEPRVVIPKEEVEKIRFEHVAVAEIFHALERMYGVDIVFDEEVFSHCSVTTSASTNDLYQRIDVICEITGATYTIEDGFIRIAGSGCN